MRALVILQDRTAAAETRLGNRLFTAVSKWVELLWCGVEPNTLLRVEIRVQYSVLVQRDTSVVRSDFGRDTMACNRPNTGDLSIEFRRKCVVSTRNRQFEKSSEANEESPYRVQRTPQSTRAFGSRAIVGLGCCSAGRQRRTRDFGPLSFPPTISLRPNLGADANET